MTKQEFLDELRSCLAGRVDDRELQAQINYYDSYITQEINSGKTIDDVMDEIGSPRLIAKTLLQAYMAKDDPISRQYSNNSAGPQNNYSEPDEYNGNDSTQYKIWKIFTIIIAVLSVFIIVGFIFRVIFYMIPVLIVMAAIYFLIKIFTS